MRIVDIKPREILNSAGNFTVECQITLSNGKSASASVPQGISSGDEEKLPVATKMALDQINNEIFPILKKEIGLDQKKLDRILQKGLWGSNTTLAVSAAFAKCSDLFQIPKNPSIPKLMVLIFEGKKHGNRNLKIQEYMIIADSIEEGRAFYKKTKDYLESNNISTLVGSEGGFSPENFNDIKILKLMTKMGAKNIALDVAANTQPPSSFFLNRIMRQFPISSLEDPLSEKKAEKWTKFLAKIQKKHPDILVVGDDLTVTDSAKIEIGAKKKRFNAVIIKPNQQGTITKAIEAIEMAKKYSLKTIVSHRGEETNDSWTVDLAVFAKADYVKYGGLCRGERISKYNRLLEITD